jgi:hypothetical protein
MSFLFRTYILIWISTYVSFPFRTYILFSFLDIFNIYRLDGIFPIRKIDGFDTSDLTTQPFSTAPDKEQNSPKIVPN